METGEDLAVFANLSDDQIQIISGMFESALEKHPNGDRIRDACGANLTGSEIKSISRMFYDFFYDIANESENVMRAINSSDLNREKRSVLLDTLEKIRKDANKIRIRQKIQRGMPEPPEFGSISIQKSVPKPDHKACDTGPKRVDLLSVLDIDSNRDDAPKTIIGMLDDYAEEGEDSRDLVRAVRDGT